MKEIPPRPDNPLTYPEDDTRHWYDYEYAGYFMPKQNIPLPPKRWDQGIRHIVCILPGPHSYMDAFCSGVQKIADGNRIEATFLTGSWDIRAQAECVDKAIAMKPDLIIMLPENANSCVEHYRLVNEAGIPVICSNLLPEPDVFRYVICWTGPDDWGQYRSLSHAFAELMHGEGGYCIIRHIPGSSSYLARTWGFIAELKRIAPGIRLLDAQTTYFDPVLTEKLVESWVDEYGDQLKGIVSSDDVLMKGVSAVLQRKKRRDVIRVSVVSSQQTLELIQAGEIHAAAYQNGVMDGALAMQTAVDWFAGLKVEPVRNLPRFIVSKLNVKDFLEKRDTLPALDDEPLFEALKQLDRDKADHFFESLFSSLQQVRFIKEEFLRGYIIQIFSVINQVMKLFRLEPQEFLGDYEDIYKQLFDQPSIEETLLWLKATSRKLIDHVDSDQGPQSTIHLLINYVETHYREPISLKTLSYEYGLSSAYLGQQFHRQTGSSFTDYLNGLRIGRAKELLETTALKEKEIAREVGYNDHNYFYRVFKKYEHISPLQYRKANLEEGERIY